MHRPICAARKLEIPQTWPTPRPDAIGVWEGSVQAEMAAGSLTRERAAHAVDVASPNRRGHAANALGEARSMAEHARQISLKNTPEWVGWCAHCKAPDVGSTT
jgi:hypothetical protein